MVKAILFIMILQGIKEPRLDLPVRTFEHICIEGYFFVVIYVIVIIILVRFTSKDKKK